MYLERFVMPVPSYIKSVRP